MSQEKLRRSGKRQGQAGKIVGLGVGAEPIKFADKLGKVVAADPEKVGQEVTDEPRKSPGKVDADL